VQGRATCVLLRGSGPWFCVGGDIREFVAAGESMPEALHAGITGIHATLLRLVNLPGVLVSAINDAVAGGGIGLALCADVVLAAESMWLRGGYSAIGLTPDVGGSWALTRLAGPMRARHILLTNRAWTARECLQAGLLAEVHADDALMPAAMELALSLSRGARGAQAGIKRLVDAAGSNSLQAQLDLEQQLMVESGATADAREGVRASLEKREAHFD
jgi:2-(1,2-epoxy-1,2-dihydrophenyl)acetyl-CoA isomerase